MRQGHTLGSPGFFQNIEEKQLTLIWSYPQLPSPMRPRGDTSVSIDPALQL